MNTRNLLTFLIVFAVVAVSGSALADGPSIGIGLRGGTITTNDAQRDPVSSFDTRPMSGFTFDIEPVRGPLFGRDRLRVGLEWDIQSESDEQLFQQIYVDSLENHLLVTVDYGFNVTDWFTPYIKLTAGLAFYDLSFDGSGPETLEAAEYGLFSGSAGAGLEFIVPYDFWGGEVVMDGSNTDAVGGRFVPGDNTVGMRLELGHTLRQTPDFTLTHGNNTPEEEADIPVQGTHLGTLPVNGLYFTADIFVRF